MVNDITLNDIMIRHVATIGKNEKVTTAGKIMALKNIGSIIVTEDEDLNGIVTEKDFLKKIIAKGLDPNKIIIKEIMTSNIKTAHPNQSIFDAFEIMKKGKFRRLPIVDENNKLLGIVTETDVSEALKEFTTRIQPKKENLSSINEEYVKKVLKESFDLKPRKSYLIIEEKPSRIYDMFLSKISEDYAGIGITRENPNNIKEKYGFKNTLFLWLTTISGNNTIKPTDLEKLRFTINSFISKSEKSIILFDGVEYIINYTSFKETLQFIQSLIDKVSTTNTILIISLDPETLEHKEFKLLSRSAEIYKTEEIQKQYSNIKNN